MEYKFLEHKADAKFQAFGKTLEEAFSNAALAMFSIMTKTGKIKPKIEKKIVVDGIDQKSLLSNFLEKILFLLDTEGFLLNKVKKIKIEKNKLNAILIGDGINSYELFGEVKAVTYNEMFIKKEKEKYIVQVVVDMWIKI